MSRATALASAGTAFALNCASFLLIGNTSALTLQLAGVVKDWLLIVMSAAVFRHALTPLNLGGYLFAFAGALLEDLGGAAACTCSAGLKMRTCLERMLTHSGGARSQQFDNITLLAYAA